MKTIRRRRISGNNSDTGWLIASAHPRANRRQHIADSSDLSVISFRAHSQLGAEFGERPELVQVQQKPVKARQVGIHTGMQILGRDTAGLGVTGTGIGWGMTGTGSDGLAMHCDLQDGMQTSTQIAFPEMSPVTLLFYPII
ncbi:unnamed protein product [Anisakis simplex]|uniref:PDZ domain-containing protein n=1 Tax=Anisakis simplex TaxID=6269 RepID=A0A0M3J2L2_ANISI|nr:unnamed protein product [Anisakis simplex]